MDSKPIAENPENLEKGNNANLPLKEDSIFFLAEINSPLFICKLLEALPFGIIYLEESGNILGWNSYAKMLLNISDKQEPKTNFWFRFSFLTELKADFCKALSENKVLNRQKLFPSNKLCKITFCPLTINLVKGGLLIFEDITLTEKLTQQKLCSQKMEAIQNLVNNLAHDFNNLISGMLMTIDYLKQFIVEENKSFNGSEIAEEVEILQMSIRKASELGQQLLAISGSKEVQFKSIDLKSLLTDLVQDCRQNFDPRVSIRLNLGDEEAFIESDEIQLKKALLNILTNAYESMTSMKPSANNWGGVLDISLCKVSASNLVGSSIEKLSQSSLWKISIEDNGVGMKAEVQKHIFEPFFTTKKDSKACGLGLSVAYSILRSLNGQITFYSEEGKGTNFNLYLPISEHNLYNAKADEIKLQKSKGTILIIEDEDIICHALDKLLHKAGYKVFCANNANEGFKLYEKYQSLHPVVLLDLMLPGESAEELFKKIQKLDPKSKIIFMSGLRKDEKVENLLKEGGQAFLQKPFRPEELINLLKD